MNLDENQKKQIGAWLEEGLKLSEIQTRLATDFGLKVTYMEVRFLVDDLKLTLKDPDPPKPEDKPKAADTKAESPASTADKPDLSGKDPFKKGVSVNLDAITKPGTLASGKVTFSDGNTADWYLDQMGRLGLVPKTEGYRPSAADVQEFQIALEKEITRAGL